MASSSNSRLLLLLALPILLLLLLLLNANGIFGASLVQVQNFGFDPNSQLQMFEYVPDNVQPLPPLVVVMHGCGGSLQQSQQLSDWMSVADQYGFIVVYAQSTHDSNCFDVYSAQGLKRDGSSDSQIIVAMVQYEIQKRNVDPLRVYATGFSSGGMMTNVLLAEYPDVFAAGSAFYAGPYTCFATVPPATMQPKCANAQIILTAQEWGDRVRADYPTFLGPWPRMQLWHGTQDSLVHYPLLQEEVKQWTNVHGLGQQPTSSEQMTIVVSGQSVSAVRARYDMAGTIFGGIFSKVEAITMNGLEHGFSAKGTINQMVAAFFGLIPGQMAQIGNFTV